MTNDANATLPFPSEPGDLDTPENSRSSAKPLGKVAAPPNKESTSEFFYFWVERGRLVERTQAAG